MNVMSVRYLLHICRNMPQLKSYVHVSTAFSNCNRSTDIDEIIYRPNIHPSILIQMVEDCDIDLLNKMSSVITEGFPNTYTATKGMAEYLLKEEGNLPIAIIRPAIVAATWKEPFPGWIDNYNTTTGSIVAINKGLLKNVLMNEKCFAEIVPADVAVNLMIVAAKETSGSNEITVYNCTSSNVNKLYWCDVLKYIVDCVKKHPANDILHLPQVLATQYEWVFNFRQKWVYYTFVYPIYFLFGKKEVPIGQIYDKLTQGHFLFKKFTCNQWEFNSDNVRKLWNSLPPNDQNTFNFDIKQINWKNYFETYHLGCKSYLLKESVETATTSRKRYARLVWIYRFINFGKWITFLILLLRGSGLPRSVTLKMRKVLLEKLLKTCPDVRAVYILIRTKQGKNVAQRLQEIFDSKAFDRIKVAHPALIKKVIALDGDITLPLFGLNSTDINLLAENVSIVFNSAANVKFEDPIKYAITTNLLSVRHLIQVCEQMNKLEAVIHVSTAYSNCNRSSIDEIIYKQHLDPSKVIEIFNNLDDEIANKICQTILGDFPNTYTFTKCLAEYLFMEEGGNLPRAIVRPGAVTCAWAEPFPGWIDSWSAWGGLATAIGLGATRHMGCYSEIATHIVPVDFCVNMFITAARQTALNKSGTIKVYHCVSGGASKISTGTFSKLWTNHSSKYPLNNMARIPSVRCNSSYFANYTLSLWDYYTFLCPMDYLLQITGNKPILRKIFRDFSLNLKTLQFFGKHEWEFSNENTMQLWNSLTIEEKKIYNFDLNQIDWSRHVENYVYGLKVYQLQEDVSTLSSARKRYKKLLWIGRLMNIFKWTILWIFLLRMSGQCFTIQNKRIYFISYVAMFLVLRLFGFSI
uniref:Fatty acyl-CoA reductase n=1 Tax=Strigamia maritima TaxID=126957 RepID=T1IQ15_STRMM